MAGTVKKDHRMEWIAGVVTLFVAAVLIVAVVLVLRGCSWVPAGPNMDAKPTHTKTTPPTQPSQPSLVPNPYGPGDFSYRNGYLACLSGPAVLGVDVSEYQGKIDWQRVSDAGVEIAMVRLGFRAWGSQGEIHADAWGLQNLQGAKAAGLKVGVYFFSQAITVEEARQEAQFVLQQLEGQSLDMPIVFDWETVPDPLARTANMTPEKLNACVLAFCQEIRNAGYEPMVYFNPDLALRMLDLPMLQQQGLRFWLAMYTDIMTYRHRVDMWQYTDGGSVDGINGRVDMNLYFTYE